jgi:hypothetical protein
MLYQELSSRAVPHFFVTVSGVLERFFKANCNSPRRSNPLQTHNIAAQTGRKGTTMFKSITLAAVVIAASASIASANGSYLSTFAPSQERMTEVELGLVVAEANGTVEIRDYRNGQIGKLLGSKAVKAGGNPFVEVEITPSFGDAVAVLTVGGNIVDTQVLNFDQHN